jgi:GNAT superfamily N-acetyltransferase
MLPDGPVVTYQEEAWSAVLPELEACWKAHWQEVAQDKALMPLDPDYAAYAALEAAGVLHVMTVRVEEELAGYHITFVRPHVHYHSTLCGFVDVYYVKPAFRTGLLPVALFRHAERALKTRGVQKLFSSYKVTAPLAPLFKRLGWVESDVLATKWIGVC